MDREATPANAALGGWQSFGSVPAEGVDCFWLQSEDGDPIGAIDGPQSESERTANAELIPTARNLFPRLVAVVEAARLVHKNPWDFANRVLLSEALAALTDEETK